MERDTNAFRSKQVINNSKNIFLLINNFNGLLKKGINLFFIYKMEYMVFFLLLLTKRFNKFYLREITLE